MDNFSGPLVSIAVGIGLGFAVLGGGGYYAISSGLLNLPSDTAVVDTRQQPKSVVEESSNKPASKPSPAPVEEPVIQVVSPEAEQPPTDTGGAETEAASKNAPAANQQDLEQALSKLVKDEDSVEGITWYRDVGVPDGKSQDYIGSYIRAYIGTKPGEAPWLRVKIHYQGYFPLYINRYLINVDGERLEFKAEYDKHKIDVKSVNKIWENYDTGADEDTISVAFLKKIANSQSTVIRFKGEKVDDYDVPDYEKKNLRDVVTAYELLASR